MQAPTIEELYKQSIENHRNRIEEIIEDIGKRPEFGYQSNLRLHYMKWLSAHGQAVREIEAKLAKLRR